jgi:hypothetical protein
VVFVPLDVFVEIANVEQKWRALAAVQVGQESVLNQPSQFPFTHAEVFCGLPGTEEAVLGRGNKRHRHLVNFVMLQYDNTNFGTVRYSVLYRSKYGDDYKNTIRNMESSDPKIGLASEYQDVPRMP